MKTKRYTEKAIVYVKSSRLRATVQNTQGVTWHLKRQKPTILSHLISLAANFSVEICERLLQRNERGT